jgi:hypothetical protein
MPNQDHDTQDIYRRNDAVLLRPLLIMGLIICGGLLFYAYAGGDSQSIAQAPSAQTTK